MSVAALIWIMYKKLFESIKDCSMRIVHFSDPHLRGDGSLSFRVVDTKAWLKTAIAHFATLEYKPDAFVITGDLADSGDEKAYHMLYTCFQPLDTPVYVVPGNHDRRDRMRSILGSWCPEGFEGTLCSAVDSDGKEGVRLLLLDTLEPGSHSGHFLESTACWLENELARQPERPTLLFMHHPPFRTGMGMMDEPFEGVERLAGIMRNYPWVQICCGHMHRPIVTRWAGCLAMTAPSIAMQIELDLSAEGGDAFRMETPGYLLHHWEHGVWNSHVCQIPCQPTFSGPHRFIGSVNPLEE